MRVWVMLEGLHMVHSPKTDFFLFKIVHIFFRLDLSMFFVVLYLIFFDCESYPFWLKSQDMVDIHS